MRSISIALLVLVLARITIAQSTFTCDGGANDALTLAEASYESGDIQSALSLAREAETACQAANNMNRYLDALALRSRLELLLTPTPGNQQAEQDRASLLITEASQLISVGRLDEALTKLYEALDILRRTPDELDDTVAMIFIGRVLSQQFDYAAAQSILEEALELQQRHNDFTSQPYTLLELAGIEFVGHGNANNALIHINNALALIEKHLDLSLPQVRNVKALLLSTKGGIYGVQGRWAEGIELIQEALSVDILSPSDKSAALDLLSSIYFGQGRYTEALNSLEEALELQAIPQTSTLVKIGEVYAAWGRVEEATEKFTEALQQAEQYSQIVSQVEALNHLGYIYADQADYGTALNHLNQAFRLEEPNGLLFWQMQTLYAIGSVYIRQGRYELAKQNVENGLNIARSLGALSFVATGLNELGIIESERKRYADSQHSFEEALEIVRTIGNRPFEAVLLNALGTNYGYSHDYNNALKYFGDALVIQTDLGLVPDVAVTRANISEIYILQNRWPEALMQLDETLLLAEGLNDQYLNVFLYGRRGLVKEYMSQPGAVEDYEIAIEHIENIYKNAAVDASIASLSGLDLFQLPFERLVQLRVSQGDIRAALTYAEQERAVLIRNELLNRPIDFRANLNDQGLLAEETRLRLEIVNAQKLVTQLSEDLSATVQAQQEAQAALDAAQGAYDSHLEQMQLQGGYLTRQLVLDIASLEEIQAVLPSDTTLLLYGLGEFGSYALLITKNDLHGEALVTTTEEIDSLLQGFASDRLTNAQVLSDIYNLIFAPIADEITTTNLIISPDGVLNYVPFVALPAADGSYLIEDYIISYIPSGTALTLLNDREPITEASSPGLVLAQSVTSDLLPLEHAESETRKIAEVLGVEPILNATEGDLRAGGTGAAVIHISAHAELNPFAPFYSAIHLGSDASYDGRFEVREVYELDLSQGTELVTLNGCDTGVGGIGEDFGLLSRAFLAAGTPRVVASLWKIDDAASGDLLAAFVSARKSMSDTAALRQAMLTVSETYPDPYYWASFVLVGQP
jgi:CHAT domain-containing protein/Tfp pilus assembly protein PilF